MIRGSTLAVLPVLAPLSLPAQVSRAEYRTRRDPVLARTSDAIVLAIGSPEPAQACLSHLPVMQNAREAGC